MEQTNIFIMKNNFYTWLKLQTTTKHTLPNIKNIKCQKIFMISIQKQFVEYKKFSKSNKTKLFVSSKLKVQSKTLQNNHLLIDKQLQARDL